jgi:hypothetical protein
MSTGAVSRYNFTKCSEFVSVAKKFGNGQWRVSGYNDLQCHFLSAGAKAKTVTSLFTLLTVLWGRAILIMLSLVDILIMPVNKFLRWFIK